MSKYLKLFENHTQYEALLGGGEMTVPNVSHCIDQNDVHYNSSSHLLRVIYEFDEEDTTTGAMWMWQNDSGTNPMRYGTEYLKHVYVNGQEVNIEEIENNKGGMGMFSGRTVVHYEFKDNTKIPAAMFYRCVDIVSVLIPDNFTEIGGNAFAYCVSLNNISNGSGITSIGDDAFHNCQLGNVKINNKNTITYLNGFSNSGLTSFEVENVNRIGDRCFMGNNSLEYIIINSITPPQLEAHYDGGPQSYVEVFRGTNDCPIYVPDESISEYSNNTNWSVVANRLVPLSQFGVDPGPAL